jgi:hypothetical protein
LVHNLDSIHPDATLLPANGEQSRPDEPGHVAFALGEFYRATGETTLKGHDLIDLAARCITAQMFTEPAAENGLAYAALGLLAFGPSKERNPVWERLVEETQQRIDKALLRKHSEGLICLSACLKGEVNENIVHNREREAEAAARDFLEIFGEGNFYLEMQDHGIPEQRLANDVVRRLSRKLEPKRQTKTLTTSAR